MASRRLSALGGVAAAFLAAACGGFGANANKVSVVNGVMKLEESNFGTALEKFPLLMVNFYAPWCGGCNGFHPKYEKAARRLRKMDMPSPRLAKVDVVVEPKLEKKWDAKVSVEPVLLVFKDGQLFARAEASTFETADDIVNYMATIAQPVALGACTRAFYQMRAKYVGFVSSLGVLSRDQMKTAKTAFPIAGPLSVLFVCLFVYGWLRGCLCCCRCFGRCCCRSCSRKTAAASGEDEEPAEGNNDADGKKDD